LPKFTRDPNNLVVNKLRDRAQVYVDGRFVGALSRENNIDSLPLCANFGKRIQILVENQGRINFQDNFDLKGILGNVTVQTFDEPYYEELTDWTITGYPFEEYEKIERFITSDDSDQKMASSWLRDGPAIYYGEFNIASEAELGDTWWKTAGWGKGSLFVNGLNLGRYWPLVGPQLTNYIPKAALKVGVNRFVALELQKAPKDLTIHFVEEPDFQED
jgi:beta-galactosidase